jgi:DNA repair protein RadC
VTGLSQISVGGLSSSVVEPRQIFKTAILANAAALILAHQHPSGNPEPSREDIQITSQIAEAGEVMDIPIHDHLIITEADYTSLAERGVIG